MKSTESVKHKDEISVDPIEEVADTTTKPLKIKEANKVKANEDKIRQMKMKMKKEVGISSIKREENIKWNHRRDGGRSKDIESLPMKMSPREFSWMSILQMKMKVH